MCVSAVTRDQGHWLIVLLIVLLLSCGRVDRVALVMWWFVVFIKYQRLNFHPAASETFLSGPSPQRMSLCLTQQFPSGQRPALDSRS